MTEKSHTGWTEADRLAALDSYEILDTPAEKTFDDIVQLACQLTGAPIAAVSLIAENRQWFKSEIGLGVRETPLDNSICKFALLQDDFMIIPDTLDDPRTECNPLVTGEPGLRFYAGRLLKTSSGLPLGTLCVLDTKPRPEGLTSEQKFALETLAQQVLTLIEMGRIVHNQKAALIEKERLEAEAHAGRERYQNLVDQAATGIVETDNSTRITLVNQKFCEMLGYTDAELTEMTLSDITHSAFLPQMHALASKLAAGGASQIIEKQYRRKDGSLMWATSSVNALRTKDGQFQGLVANIVDVTERKLAENALRISEERFRSLVTAVSQIIWTTDAQGQTIEDSPSWREFTGQSYDEWKGAGWLDAVHPDDRQHALRTWENSTKSKTVYANEFRVRRADGGYRWTAVRAVPLFNEDGAIREWMGTSTDITDMKQAQDAIQVSEERLHFALKAGYMAAWDWNLATGRTIRSNMSSLVPGVVTGGADDFYKLIHPDDREQVLHGVEQAKTGEAPYDFEFRMLSPDGRVIWLADKAQLRVDPSDGQQHLTGVSMDMTASKLAERERQRFVSLAEHSNEFIGMADADLNFYFVNPAGIKMVGLDSMEQACGIQMTDFFFPEDQSFIVNEFLPRATENGSGEVEIRFRNFKTGDAIWVIYTAFDVRDEKGNVIGHTTVSRDITDRKNAEQKLREAAQRLQFTLEAAHVGDWEFDLISGVNHRSLRHDQCFGYREPVAEWGPEQFFEHVHSEDREPVREKFEAALLALHGWHFECRVIWPDNSIHWIAVHGSLHAENGVPVRIRGIIYEITEQKQNEENLRKLAADLSESNRRKTEFLATLAHELRNPLAPIRTGLDLLSIERDTEPTVSRVREMIGRQVDHMTHLVNDLLDVARINSGKVELRKTRVELKAIVSSAVETSMPLVGAKHHELRVDLPEKELWLDADITRLAQVLGNLLSNAAKYTPNNGRITVTARQDNDEIIVSIIDSGIGIPADSLSDVFDMFTQVGRNTPHAQGGLGIGLSLVRRLVELHDGTVSATSAGLGQGSEFIVRLPLVKESETPDLALGAPEKEPDLLGERQLRILVVDDNVDAAQILAELLGIFGHLVMVSNDGREALRIAQEFRPDLAMLDIGMPGMNGYEVAQEMRKLPETQQTILAALTGWGAEEDRARSREAGFDHHLTKPVDMKALKKLLSFISDTVVDQ